MGVMMGPSIKRQRTLGDADRQVPHAFEVGVDLEGRNNQPQVGRHGLLKGKQVNGELVDLDFDGVNARFCAENLFGGVAVLLRDRADTALDGGLDDRAHFEQLGLQLFQFFDKVAQDGQLPNQPKRPVT